MGAYTEKAIELFKSGCCCSQAVAGAFSDKLGDDAEKLKEDVFRYRLGKAGYCGALLGAKAVANYMRGVKDREDPACESELSADITSLISSEFKGKIGEELCREIKGKQLRSCGGCVKDAVSILEKLIEEGKV